MFKDYRKLNKVPFVLNFILLIMFIVLQIVFVILMIMNNGYEEYSTINQVIYVIDLVLNLLLGLNIIGLFISALKIFIGKSRSILLTYRNRSYYLKMQLIVASCSALVSSMLYLIWQCTHVIYINNVNFSKKIPLGMFINEVNIEYMINIFCLFMLLYYFSVYIIDLFANTNYRYRSLTQKYGQVLIFFIRCSLIAILGFMLYLSPETFALNYQGPHVMLINSNITELNNTFLLIPVMLVIVLVIDYMCFFKKKVIV